MSAGFAGDFGSGMRATVSFEVVATVAWWLWVIVGLGALSK
jgi:hypothetical protein